jgi:hypothetical protein
MKSLNEQIKEVMQSKSSKADKVKSLTDLGFSRVEIDNLFRTHLNEQINDVMKKDTSKAVKTKDLIELGLQKADITRLMKVYEVEGEVRIQYTLGIEIECYHVDSQAFINGARAKGVNVVNEQYNHDTRNHYKIVNDGSIIGENAIECVSPVLKGKTGLKSLKVVCDSLNEAGAQVNKSTGLHVHVGLQNIGFEQYKNIFINYINLEGVIDTFMAKSRRNDDNTYCKSLVSKNITACVDYSQIAYIFNNSRYFKLNPVSYVCHNTLEFRQHQGTTDYAKIEMWVSFICKLVTWSKTNRLSAKVSSISDIPFLSNKEKTYFINRAAALV